MRNAVAINTNSSMTRKTLHRLLAGALSVGLFCQVAKADTFNIVSVNSPEVNIVAKKAAKLYKSLGHETTITQLPARRSLIEANRGRYDAELGRIPGMESAYPNLVRVTEPIHFVKFAILVLKTSSIAPRSWEGMEGLTVVYPNGYRLLDLRTEGMERIPTSSPESVAKMVMHGRVQVGILLRSDALRLAKEFDGLKVIETDIETVALFHYVHIKHRGLVPALEQSMRALNAAEQDERKLGAK